MYELVVVHVRALELSELGYLVLLLLCSEILLLVVWKSSCRSPCKTSCQKQQNARENHAKVHVGGSKTSLSSFFIILDIMGELGTNRQQSMV